MMETILRAVMTVDVKGTSISRSTGSKESNRELVTVALMRDGDPSRWVRTCVHNNGGTTMPDPF